MVRSHSKSTFRFLLTSPLVRLLCQASLVDAVGINLANASGYIKYDVDQKNTTELNVNLSTIQRVTESLNVEASVGATSNTNGAKSVNCNVRVRYLF